MIARFMFFYKPGVTLRAGGLVLVDAEGKEVNVEALRTTTQPDGDGKIIMIVM